MKGKTDQGKRDQSKSEGKSRAKMKGREEQSKSEGKSTAKGREGKSRAKVE